MMTFLWWCFLFGAGWATAHVPAAKWQALQDWIAAQWAEFKRKRALSKATKAAQKLSDPK